MAATKADFTGLSQTGEDIAAQWPGLVRAVQSLTLLFLAKAATGIEPDDVLSGLMFGDGTKSFAWRVFYDGADLLIQENTGTDGSPVWATRNTISATTGLGALAASAITSGTFADARVAASNVTQHEASLTHGNLGGLATGDPHTQYAKKVGDTFTGTATFSGSPPISGVALVDLSDGAAIQSRLDDETYQQTDTNQTGITSETAIQFATPDVGEGVAFPGADGVKDYFVQYSVPLLIATNPAQCRFIIRAGGTGTTSDPIARNNIFFNQDASRGLTMTFLVKVSNPSASDVATLTVERTSGTGTISIEGASRHGAVRIWRAA